MCKNLNEFQRHCAEGKKPVSESYIVSDSMYVIVSKGKALVMENGSVVVRGRGCGKCVTIRQHAAVLRG